MKLNMTQRMALLAADNHALREQVSLLTTERDNARARIATLVGKPARTPSVLSPYRLAASKARELAAKTGKPVKVGA